MQDWADRLDLLERGEVKAASLHLTISINGMQVRDEGAGASADVIEPLPVQRSTLSGAPIWRLSAVPLQLGSVPAADNVASGV